MTTNTAGRVVDASGAPPALVIVAENDLAGWRETEHLLGCPRKA
jgi:hypothetical protein